MQYDNTIRRSGRPWRRLREEILKRDARVCFYCGSAEASTVDHVTPLSKGGTDSPANLVACCKRCNLRKGEKTGDEFIRSQQMKRFFRTPDTPPTPAMFISPKELKTPFEVPEKGI